MVTPLVVWGLVEQNVAIVAACIPTLRPFFYKAFKTKSSQAASRTDGSAFKLSSHPCTHNTARGTSISEVPLYENDVGPNTSRKGIWKTQEVSIESDEDVEAVRLGVGGTGKRKQFNTKPWEKEGARI